MKTRQEWLELLMHKPIYSSHEHHREQEYQQQLDLELLLTWSYVGWCGSPPEPRTEARREWLDRIRYNTYFVWLEKAICSIYGFDSLNEDNWDAVSEAIRSRHRSSPHWHLDMMKQYGGYIGFLEDCYWDTGSSVGYPEFITPVYRLDLWMQGYHPESLTNEGTSPHSIYGVIDSFDAYVARMEEEIRTRRPGIAGLKCASAYQRTIGFRPVSREEAAAVYGRRPGELTTEEKNAFGDYMLQHALTLAEELRLPVQIHTGLAMLSGSNPMLLEPLIASHPNNTFVLFHGGFPWIYETAALAHNYPNVVIDINWLPLISTSAAADALHVYLDVLRDSGHIAWGGDTWTGEEAVGASLAFRHLLARVLAEKCERDGWTDRHAERLADKIMYENAMRLYGIRRTGTAPEVS